MRPTAKRPPAAAAHAGGQFGRTNPDHLDSRPGDGIRRLPYRPPSGPLVSCTVARGRTVEAPIPDGEKIIAGFDSVKGEYAYAVPCQRFGPGEVVMLQKSEADRIRLLGFLEDEHGDQADTSGTVS